YSAEGTTLTSEDLGQVTPTLIRTKADQNGVVGIYFAPKGLVDGAVIDVTKTIDQGRLVYVIPPESHVEDGKLVGDGPAYSPDAPYPPMTIGQPWHAGGALTQPIESVQVSKGFLHEVPSHKIPQEQRGGVDIFDQLIKYVNDHKRAEQAAQLAATQKMPPQPTPEKSDENQQEPELTRRQKLLEKLSGVVSGASYLGQIALIEAAYHAGNVADRVSQAKDRISDATLRMAERAKIFRNGTAENLTELAYKAGYLGNIAMIDTVYVAGNAKDSAAFHAGNVADGVSAFIRDRLQRLRKKEGAADTGEELPSDEHDAELVSRQHNWDWGPDPGFEWEDDWGR
ncbi:MAG: hypothetical protein ACREJM_01080, partial [Candidatus Saccharimonadales bacterium]